MRRFVLVFLLTFTALSAHAGTPLMFRDEIRGVREHELLDYFKLIDKYDPGLPYRIATVDLNGDGVEEWILRQNITPACQANADCRFVVGGLSEGRVVLIGEMHGGKIGVSGEKRYGVRKLLVYNNKSNDFTYQTYVWTPSEQTFRPE